MNKIPKLRFNEFSGDWEIKKLGDLADICTGKKDTQDKIEDGKYPFFVRSQTIERINSYSFDGEAILTAGDGVGVGKVFHYLNEKFDYHQRVYKLSDFKEGTNGRYIYEYFKKNFIREVTKYTAKTSVDSVRMEMITKMDIPHPSIQEQEKIASFFSLIDDKISLQGEKVEALKDYKKGVMQKIFSRELRFKGDDGRDYPAWEEKKLGDLGKFYRGHSYNAGDVNEDGLLVLRSNNIQDNTITFDTDLQFVRKQCKDEIKLREKDIVICMANGSRNLVGKSGEFNNSNGYNDLTVGAFCSIYRTKNPLGKYLLQIELYYKYLDILLSGTNINNLKNSQLEELQFNIPTSNEETEKIVKILSDIDLKIKKEQEKLYYLNEYKKGLLQHMFV